MKSLANPVRLFGEIVLAIAASELVVMTVLPLVAPGLSGVWQSLLDVLLLGLLCGPVVYWRCISAFLRPAPLGGRSESKALGLGAAFGMTAVAQLLGLIITASGVTWQKSAIDATANSRFESGAERIKIEVQRRLNLPLYGLRGARGTYATSGQFTRQGFREYVDSRDNDAEFPGIRGFGFIERVRRDDLPAFLARERADGVPGFDVHTSGDASDLYIVKYIEPLSTNLAAWGYDLGQDAARREVVERAASTGQAALSSHINLQQDEKNGSGFLYVLPVYRRGADPVTPAQHLAALAGLLYTPIVVNEMMQGVSQAAEGLLDFELFDSEIMQDKTLIFDADHHLDGVVGTIADNDFAGRLFQSTSKIVVGGRTITLRVSSTPAFEGNIDHSNLMFVGAGGVLVSFLGALAVWLLAVGRLRAQRRAQHMTADLDRLARVAQHTTNAVTIADPQMRITWVNEGFTDISGYTLEEALGRTPGDLLGSGKSDPAAIETLRRSIKEGTACRVDVINRAKNGREYWIDTEVQPTRDANGVVTGFIEIGTDITTQKQTQQRLEAAMRESDTLLTTLHVHAIVSVADSRGRLIEVNDAFCQISKYSREELIGQDHSIVNSGVHTVEFWTDMWGAISRGLSWRGDICNRAKDGSLYWVDSMIAAFVGDDGTVERYVSIRTDITKSKANQQHMVEMTDRLTLAIEGGSDGLWDCPDVRSDAQWWSPSYYTLIGYTPEELPASGSNFQSLVHPDHLSICNQAWSNALAAGADYDEEHLLLTKHRGYRWFRSRAKVYRNAQGEPVRIAGSAQDIHDRKLAEAEVRRADKLLRDSIEALDDAFVLYDPQDRLVICNQRYKDFYPASAAVMEPGNSFEEILRYGLSRGQYQAAVGREEDWLAERLLAHSLPLSRSQQVLADGKVLRVVERRMEDGHTVGFRVDVTDLVRATHVAEEASRSKSQFLANMSHEIRTPMNAILGMLKLLQSTELSARQLDYAAKTEGAARSLLGLLNDILDFSKVEAGKMTLDPRPFRVDRLMRDLSVILSANVGNKDIEVLFDIDAAVPKGLVGDDMRLQQVLINLGGNAIKFTSRGEVVLRLRVMEQTADDVLLEFAVRDSGIGIAPENQERIFSGFSQAEASTTRRFGGTGLGLAISSRMVSLLGGDLQLHSVLGEGSTFHFQMRFPVADVPSEKPGAPPLAQATGMRTLVVDDNDLARELLAGMARSLGWSVDVAAGGAQAVAMVQAEQDRGLPYQAIFMDWQMPDLDGWQSTQRIRAVTASGSSAPLVLMVTAHGRENLSERTAQEQAMLNGFLVKPVTSSMLFDAVMDASAASALAALGHNPGAPKAAGKVQRLQGMRLLVVEDNKINQMVAKGLLEQEGADVSLAENGQLGVEAVAHADPGYDIVLMDVQMPVMDGYEATRAIRNQLGRVDLPIVAMTANAMASDRVACLAAGMNDHVGKPFELDHLVAILRKYSGRSDTPSIPAKAAAATPAPSVWPVGDLDVTGALSRMGGNTTMFATVLQTFAQDMARVPAQLASVLSAAQLPEAVRAMHTLKGLAATVGARHLAQIALGLEVRLKQGVPLDEHAEMVQTLQAAVDATAAAMAPVLARYAKAPAPKAGRLPGPGDATLVPDVQALLAMLERSDMSALEGHARIRSVHGEGLGTDWEALDAAMADLDFDSAAMVCRQWLEQKAHDADAA